MATPLPPTELPPTEPVSGPSITIRVTGHDGIDLVRPLATGDAIVVGSSPACGIRIQGDLIAAMHCTISYEDGQLVIEDWDTGGGTYVDGERIARRAVADPGVAFRVGDYQFATELVPCDEATEARNRAEVPAEEPQVLKVPAPQQSNQPVGADRDLLAGFDEVWDAADDSDLFSEDEYESASGYEAAYENIDSAADDTQELLQIEVEFLRNELAERDARISELRQIVDAAVTDDADLPSREEVESLVGRLEDLLVELDHSDERLKTMSELLRVSEEANLAAEEERSQMESWISEVERRVRQWEEEWHAERESLNRKIAELTTQRDAAETQSGGKENTELLKTLRLEIDRQEAQITRLQSERDVLQQRMESSGVASVEERLAEAVEVAMREERLQLSQAKAECARERAKLAQQQEEMASQRGAQSCEPDLADVRIRAFREHLKEVKASDPNPRPAPSMSNRLGKLWRKIEGRPLDTD